VDFKASGAVPGKKVDTATIKKNTELLNSTVASLGRGDTFVVSNETFMVTGGVQWNNLVDVTIRIDGTIKFSDDDKHWPKDSEGTYLNALIIANSTNLLLTSSGQGTFDGSGDKWWGIPYVGYLERGKNRPPLMTMNKAENVVMEHILLLNSPRFHFTSSGLRNATIRYVCHCCRHTLVLVQTPNPNPSSCALADTCVLLGGLGTVRFRREGLPTTTTATLISRRSIPMALTFRALASTSMTARYTHRLYPPCLARVCVGGRSGMWLLFTQKGSPAGLVCSCVCVGLESGRHLLCQGFR